MNTIPFDLEKYKAGAIAVDRNGDKYRFIAVCLDAEKNHQLISLNKDMIPFTHSLDDNFYDTSSSCYDLIGLLPQKKTSWVQKSLLFSDEEYERLDNRKGCIKVEYYE